MIFPQDQENLSDPGDSLVVILREGGDSESFASDSEDEQYDLASESESDSKDEQYDGGFGDLARFEEFRLAKGLKGLIE